MLLAILQTPAAASHGDTLAPVVLALANEPRAFGQAWNLAGFGTITQREFVTRIFREAGHKLKFFVAGKTLLRLMGLFNPIMRELVEMHYLQTTPVILDDTALRGLLGPVHKTTYDEGIRQTLAAAKKALRTGGEISESSAG